jgi:hypothetical protein
MQASNESRRTPLGRLFVVSWLIWYVLSLPFIIGFYTDRLTRAGARDFLFNIHTSIGLLVAFSVLATYSQFIFVILLIVGIAREPKSEVIQKVVLAVLSLLGCGALIVVSRSC